MAMKRVRAAFDDHPSVLTREQLRNGLHRSWVLIRPEICTVADLADHVASSFGLQSSCPDGVTISMDGFVLPPFESTAIFREEDIISVKRKILKNIEDCREGSSTEDPEIAEKQAAIATEKILALEFQEHRCRHQKEKKTLVSMTQEDSNPDKRPGDKNIKKRVGKKNLVPRIRDSEMAEKQEIVTLLDITNKSEDSPVSELQQNLSSDKSPIKRKLDNLERPECSKKRRRIANQHSSVIMPNGNGFIQPEQRIHNSRPNDNEYSQPEQNRSHRISCCVRELSCNGSKKVNASVAAEINLPLVEETQSPLRNERENTNLSGKVNVQDDDAIVKKLPSRSARRKKAKRLYIRTTKGISQEKLLQEYPNDSNCAEVSYHAEDARQSEKGEKSEQLGMAEEIEEIEQVEQVQLEAGKLETIVPVIVRPGHIRFESTDEEPKNVEVNPPLECVPWNNITSKKRGRKWGLDSNRNGSETSNWRKNGHNSGFYEVENGSSLIDDSDKLADKDSINAGKSCNKLIDFASLSLLTQLPKEGDWIVYRILELSASLTPEISSFRVGEVAKYNPSSQRIILVPVSDYPLPNARVDEDEGTEELGLSPYNADGSLEIEYPSLFDVKLLKDGDLNSPSNDSISRENIAKPSTSNFKSSAGGDNMEETNCGTAELGSGTVDPVGNSSATRVESSWDKAVDSTDGKDDPVQENGCKSGTKHKSSTSAWSYRALRGGALGPTMALLRKRNRMLVE